VRKLEVESISWQTLHTEGKKIKSEAFATSPFQSTIADTTLDTLLIKHSCCVDEVAAQHISADVIIHYGRSCQSP
jgi:diphthamide biosynthesis enzyme Dph1/Dph2-like protein